MSFEMSLTIIDDSGRTTTRASETLREAGGVIPFLDEIPSLLGSLAHESPELQNPADAAQDCIRKALQRLGEPAPDHSDMPLPREASDDAEPGGGGNKV